MNLAHMIRATAVAAVLVGAGGVRAATSLDDLVPKDLPVSLSGAYLAGRSADGEHSYSDAIPYYESAYDGDITDTALGERLVTIAVADGQMNDAFNYAQKVLTQDPTDSIALIVLGTQALEAGQFDKIDGLLSPVDSTALGKLTGGIMSAWASFGLGNVDAAVKTIDGLSGPSWYDIFKQYHLALILDAAGREADAAASIEKAYQSDSTALQVVMAYAVIEARNGAKDKAVKALNDFLPNSPVQAPVIALQRTLGLGQKPMPIAGTPQAGAAELLYGLGVAIGTDQGAELPALYLRLASVLNPTDDLTVLSLGDVFQSAMDCDEAVDVYQTVPMNSPLRRNADLQISNCLVTLNRPAEAIPFAKRVVDQGPKDIDAIIQLGNVYRANNQFTEAAQAYSLGIPASGQVDWQLLYYRGVAYTMANQWPQAEADFERALMVNPGQPQVLNYLGYSWVDRGEHLAEAVSMIKMAVDQRPDDGYIVDSLGWADYRLGDYADAVTQLEHAVQLDPEDSTLNDHLGDAYWKVGRKLDATFQWAHARDYNPDPMDLPKIEAKLEHGLDAVPQPAPLPDPASTVASGAGAGQTVTVQAGDTLSSIAARVYGDSSQYQRLYDANRSLLKDPNALAPGMVLAVPAVGAH